MTHGYLSLQSSPVRVSNCTFLRSMRADIRDTVELYLMEPLRPGGSGLDELAELGRGSNVEEAPPHSAACAKR
jgi:hypothetical protein